MSNPPLLALRGVSKRFPGVLALDAVDFTLLAGEVHAVMGENGAGKSTLIKVMTGVYSRESGSIELSGEPINPKSPLEAQALGISTVYQEVNLIPDLSVAENLFLGRQPSRFGSIRWSELRSRAKPLLERLDLHIDADRALGSYSVAIQQMVAIARALDLDAKALVLDEPTSSLDVHEVGRLFEVVRKLKAGGMGIVFVSHFLGQVYEIADRITILRNGKLVGEHLASELPQIELVSKMIGRELAGPAESRSKNGPPPDSPTTIRATGIGRKRGVEPLDIDIRRGEVVGMAGLLGSGRTETARLLFGIDRADSGSIEFEGKPVRINSPGRALALGIGFCPEDRKAQGILPHLSVRDNVAIAIQAKRGWFKAMSRQRQLALAERYIAEMGITTTDAEKPVGELSGGNQQKVILARWLASEPRLLILDEPTRGIDIGAKAEVEKLVADLCERGLAILFISSELDEVLRDSHRVVVMRDRAKVSELVGAEATEDAVMQAIAAVAP